MIKILKDDYSIRLLCEALGMHRCNLYHEPRPDEDRTVKEALRELAGAWPTYGYRRLTVMLRREGLKVNAKRVRRLMHELGICGEAPKRTPRTTDSSHLYPRFPNLVEGLEATCPDQVWVADITYVRLRKEFVYLSVLMDVFTRCIRGWHLGRSLEQELTLTALERAFERGRPEIHHSDQGVQYAATAYVDMLKAREVQISMARVGEPEENGYAERLMRTIKTDPTRTRTLHTRSRGGYNKHSDHLPLGFVGPGPLVPGSAPFPRRICTMPRHPSAVAPPRA
jgi:putative transposase